MTETTKKETTTSTRGRKPASVAGLPKKEVPTTEEIQKVLNTPEAQAIMQAMIAKALSEQKQEKTIERYIPQAEPTVALLYMGSGAEGSMVHLNDVLGDIQVRGGTRDIPKKEFLQNITPTVLKRLKDRRLVVLDGLTDDERERYGIKYTDGELLGQDIYYKLLGMDEDKIVSIFKKACYRHKQLIATLFADAYNAKDNRINLPLIKRLNTISKKTDPSGMFTAIQKDMAKSIGDESDE